MDKGVNFTGVLLIVFVILKLTGNIQWGWLWVLSPLWIPLAIVAFVGVIWLFSKALKNAWDR